ncbi:MAG: PD-(D/E)XK nuclease family protein, partial [Phycisphaerae bacterium]
LCQHVDITILLDASLSSPGPRSRCDVGAARLFRKTRETHSRLCHAFAVAGLTMENPLVLCPQCPPRFQHNPSIEEMERSLFTFADDLNHGEQSGAANPSHEGKHGLDARGACAPGSASTRAGAHGLSGPVAKPAPTAVELVELPSQRTEVDYAVSRICGWVQDPRSSYRYRNIAVIVRDLGPYHDLLSEALAARGIPFFIDHRRRIAHHPLVELLRAAVGMVTEEFSLGSLQLAFKTGLIPLEDESLDELENFVVAHGLHGFDTWLGSDWAVAPRAAFGDPAVEPDQWEKDQLGRVNATRRAFVALVDPWLKFALAANARRGPEWTEAILNWFEHLDVRHRLGQLADTAEHDGDADLAAEHRQVWRDMLSFLDDLSHAFSDLKLTIEELADVLEHGLSNMTLGLAPPMVDQVLVGSIDRSRHPDIQAAIVLGFNDGVFPARPAEDPVLNEDDRKLLALGGLEVAPPPRDRLLDEALLVYLALTRASDALVVTYAAADNQGKALLPSPYISTIRDACHGLSVTRLGDPVRRRATWDILSSRDLAGRILMEFRARPERGEDDDAVRGRWNALYDDVRNSLAEDSTLRWTMTAFGGPDKAGLSAASVNRLFPQPLGASVSQFETYAACPFKYFLQYGLKLRERSEAALAPLDVGRVHHAILEDVVGTLSTRDKGLARLTDTELLAYLHASCHRVAARMDREGVLCDARNAYLLSRSASHLARVLRSQRKVSQAGRAWPRAAELPFGFGTLRGLPAVELTTPGGRRVLLRGYIDRVDLAELGDELLGIVIDYKRTRGKQLELSAVYHGLSLQLVAYLLVLAQHGESLAGRRIVPAAGLYVSLSPRYQYVDHPELASLREAATLGCFRPRGVLRDDAVSALDPALETGWSGTYNLYRKKDGELGQIDRSDAVSRGSFNALLEHAKAKMGELADGILDGDIAVNPCRAGTYSACSWCPMASVCRFEMGISDVRFLDTLKRSEVFQRLSGDSAPQLQD